LLLFLCKLLLMGYIFLCKLMLEGYLLLLRFGQLLACIYKLNLLHNQWG